jgi:hypothetical protein
LCRCLFKGESASFWEGNRWEQRKKKSSSSPTSRIQGKEKTHSTIQNGTVSASLFLVNSRWNGAVLGNFNLCHFKVALHLKDLVRDFSCEICKTRCPMSQSLDDMHASLPDLKYRSPFLLNLLVCLMEEDLLFLIWVIFVV